MDLQDFDPFNVPAWSQVQHDVSQEPQTSQAGQDGFEQHLAEARQAEAAPIGAGGSYPHLSTEDRDLIDRAIAQYTAQKNPQPNTVKLYTQALRRLANDLRARGETTDLRDHQSLVNHLDTYFPKDALMKTGVSVLRAYHDSGHMVSRGRPRALPSAKDASNDGQQSPDEAMDARARSNLLASEEAPINHEHDAAQSRAAKRQRTLNDLEEVLVYRKPSASAASGGSGGAMPVASTGVIIRGQWDRRPLYPEDAADIFRLEEALIEGGTAAVTAKQNAGSLIGYSRWLFAKNKPSIVARLDGKSLSDGSDVREFSGASNSNRLVKALEHLRTFRSTGVVVPIVRPGRTRAKLNPPNVPPINPETASLTDPIRIDAAAAQHRALQEAKRQEEHQEVQENLPVPLASALLQGQVAVDPEQLPQEHLRRGLDHLDDEAIPLPVPVRSEEELQRLEKNLHDELQGRLEDHAAPSFFMDPQEFTFDPDQFSPAKFRRLLEDEDAQEVTEGRDDRPATSAFVQEQVASDSEQLPQADLRRVLDHLDDQPSDSPISVPPEELRQRKRTCTTRFTDDGMITSLLLFPLIQKNLLSIQGGFLQRSFGNCLMLSPQSSYRNTMINSPRRLLSRSKSHSIQSSFVRGSVGEYWILSIINTSQSPCLPRSSSNWKRTYMTSFTDDRIITLPLQRLLIKKTLLSIWSNSLQVSFGACLMMNKQRSFRKAEMIDSPRPLSCKGTSRYGAPPTCIAKDSSELTMIDGSLDRLPSSKLVADLGETRMAKRARISSH
ncbi:hypothetical protein GGD65_006417 [Bradyrhizobium sp. CIR18]|uniref:hypothetical protein n=1 Tax=Bradyrhizobium sp. CIR18 TaxID=2663839 RepID=UPI001606D672|nr:hypothetical protein [Bradyrhizobium sp. CIR18]MBB4365351.1 hypothetical protein [Bradyrhizobium sp. CIR18]